MPRCRTEHTSVQSIHQEAGSERGCISCAQPCAGVARVTYARFFHGLANPTRLRLLHLLLTGEQTVSELVVKLGVSQSQVELWYR